MAVLVGMSEDVQGRRVEMDGTDVSIGRASDNTISIDSGSVSGQHCRIFFMDGKYYAEDLGSTNGTRINGKKLTKETQLKNKNLIQVGAIEFLYEDDSAEAVEELSQLDTDIEISTDAALAPESFTNISPFSSKTRESIGMWYGVVIILCLLAAGSIGFFVWTMLSA